MRHITAVRNNHIGCKLHTHSQNVCISGTQNILLPLTDVCMSYGSSLLRVQKSCAVISVLKTVDFTENVHVQTVSFLCLPK